MKKEIKSEIYRMLHPKLTLLVTSVSRSGKPNVMTCAWATPVSEEPPLLLICLGKGGYTSRLIKETKEFAINIPTAKLMKAIRVCGTKTGKDCDKAKLAGLSYEPAKKIKAPLIKECAGHLECRLFKKMDGGECNIFIGKVLRACADRRYFKSIWLESARVPMHAGGEHFSYPVNL